MIEERNAIIESVRITNDDHGLLSAWLMLDYGGLSQGFGGYGLYSPKDGNEKNYGGHWIWRCMEVGGVTEWADLRGKAIRVRCDHYTIKAIGHIIKDIWFDPEAEFKDMRERAT